MAKCFRTAINTRRDIYEHMWPACGRGILAHNSRALVAAVAFAAGSHVRRRLNLQCKVMDGLDQREPRLVNAIG